MPKLDENIYGGDPVSKSQSEAAKALDGGDPTLDVYGEKDDRAKSEGNHGKQG